MKYKKLCEEILQIIPRENIKTVSHCVTRLRLVLTDPSNVDREALSKIDGIIQVKESEGQLQLVMGTHVTDVYDEFCQIAGVADESPREETKTAKGRRTPFSLLNDLMGTISVIISPILSVLIGGGLIKGLSATITAFHWLPADSSILTVLNILGDATFYFTPFFLGYSSAKRFKIKEVYGIMIAGCLMYPTLLNQTAGETIKFLFISIPAVSYASSIFPIMLAVWVFSLVYKRIDRLLHQNLKLVFSVFLTTLITMPFILGYIAPFGTYIQDTVSAAVNYLFSISGPVGGAIYTGLKPLMVMFGIKSFGPIIMANLSTLGYDYLLAMAFISNFAVAGAVFGAYFKMTDSKNRSNAATTGGLCILGITEPALYGILIPCKKPLYASILGGAIGGALAMILSVKCYIFSMPGIFSLPTYVDEGNNIIMIIITLLITFVSSFVISCLLMKKGEDVSYE